VEGGFAGKIQGAQATSAPVMFEPSQRFLKLPRDRKDLRAFCRKREMAIAKKRAARKSVQQQGWVTFEGGFAARQCVVHDLSSTGAKITVADSSVLAGRVRLAFSRDAKAGRNCQVVWRRGKSFGVKFVR
jgi:PilZ domain